MVTESCRHDNSGEAAAWAFSAIRIAFDTFSAFQASHEFDRDYFKDLTKAGVRYAGMVGRGEMDYETALFEYYRILKEELGKTGYMFY